MIEGGSEFFDSEPALVISMPPPAYPEAARGTGATAEIAVGILVDEAGRVSATRIDHSHVEGTVSASVFEEAALAAARQARCHPATERGTPVAGWTSVTVNFGGR